MSFQRFTPHTNIVMTLKNYGEVELDFLAELVGRSPTEVEGYLQNLEEDGIVRQQGSKVSLVDSPDQGRRFFWQR